MFRYLLMLGLVSTALGNRKITPFQTCNNNSPQPINVYVEECDTLPCAFRQLEDAVVHITYRSHGVMREIRARAVAYLGVVPLIYPLGDQTNACRGLTNSRCPVVQGEVLEYTLRMYVEPFMTVGTQVNLEFTLINNDNNSNIICIRVPIRVDPPRLK